MKQLTNKDYEEWEQYKDLRTKGLLLTPDGIRFICEAYDFDAEKIGKHFLDLLPTIYLKHNRHTAFLRHRDDLEKDETDMCGALD